MLQNPSTHQHHTRLDCVMRVLPLDTFRSDSSKRYAIDRALKYPDCYRNLSDSQRATLILDADILGMSDAALRLMKLDDLVTPYAPPHPGAPVTLSLSRVVPNAVPFLTWALLAIGAAMALAVFLPH